MGSRTRAVAVLVLLMTMLHPPALATVLHPQRAVAPPPRKLRSPPPHAPSIPTISPVPVAIPAPPPVPASFPSAWAVPVAGWFQPLNASAVLTHLNLLRAFHNAPPVRIDPTLTAFAQTWANHLGGTRLFSHSGSPSYGENLSVATLPRTHSDTQPPVGGGFPSTPAVLASLDRWYAESSLYNVAAPGYSEATGHFTQLVWANSLYIGVGYAVWGDALQSQAVVCMNFYPPGNILSTLAFSANVQ